ncbi:SAM-dependent methyltransferase [Nocardioides sp.]|uniref:SAM-dependent methyltransferase n=1 Tax=Nocardioides sp. TaxID=35761 RepID=UPI003D0979A3
MTSTRGAPAADPSQQQWRTVADLDLAGLERLLVVSAHPVAVGQAVVSMVEAAERLGMVIEHVVCADRDVAPDALVDVVCRSVAAHERPERTLVCAPWRYGGDRDHAAVGQAARVAAARCGSRLVEYPSRLADETVLISEPGEATDVFETLHDATADPWGVDHRWYEQRKRAVTMASLPRRRFVRALEIGCSVGALTVDLAGRCDRLVSVDASASAVRSCAERVHDLPGVDVSRRIIPAEWPEGTFDLIVLSESGYFLTPLQLETTLERIRASLTPDGVVLACHWRHPIRGWPLDGEIVHQRMIETLSAYSWEILALHLEPDFVLHVFGADPSVLPDPQEQT